MYVSVKIFSNSIYCRKMSNVEENVGILVIFAAIEEIKKRSVFQKLQVCAFFLKQKHDTFRVVVEKINKIYKNLCDKTAYIN